MELTDAAWLSGLFEGEGSFTIHKESRAVGLSIQMTDLDVLEKVRLIAGGYIVKVAKRQNHWKDCWKWTLASRDSIPVVNSMIPFLGTRRQERARFYLSLIDTADAKKSLRHESASNLREEVKELRLSGLTHQQIADKVGKERSYISHILRGKYDGS